MIQQNSRVAFATRSLMLMLWSAVLFSFSKDTGGDSYTISLNDQVLLEEHVVPGAGPKAISVRASGGDDVLRVDYSHCGKRGVSRSIAVRLQASEAMKRWNFADNAGLEIPLSEITSFAKEQAALQLVYFSREIPEGKVLAVVTFTGNSGVARSQAGQ